MRLENLRNGIGRKTTQEIKEVVDPQIPRHVAIIMDGNRRWAEQQGVARIDGHRRGLNGNLEPTVRHAAKRGIKELTIWALSTGNWDRGEEQMGELFKVFRESFDDEMIDRFVQEGTRVRSIGRLSQLPRDIQRRLKDVEKKTKNGKNITVNFAINYGGREEILDAVNDLPRIRVRRVTKEKFSKHLYAPDMSDVDLLIRPGGEERMSGFMLWEAPYAELVFSTTLWPDFSPQEFDAALKVYAGRERRFGGNPKPTTGTITS